MQMHFPVLASILAAHVAMSAAIAAEPNISGQRLAATCANCHGTNGISAGGAIPSLAGISKATLASSMKAFKTGTRQATIMHQIARGYTDEQIESIAGYLAAQKK
jgi:sulfide dehydrogenase cytochrome subunit